MNIQDFDIDIPVFVELEGAEVLKFMEPVEYCARYGVVGFPDEQVNLIDYRTKGLEAICDVLYTRQLDKFPENFCFPSRMRLRHRDNETLIELYDLLSPVEPEFMLWITTGLEEPIPDYQYPFFRINPLSDSLYAFVSIFNYRRFQNYFDGTVEKDLLKVHIGT